MRPTKPSNAPLGHKKAGGNRPVETQRNGDKHAGKQRQRPIVNSAWARGVAVKSVPAWPAVPA
eukprot:1048462-Lingulodinium_polyedra.AAC.1